MEYEISSRAGDAPALNSQTIGANTTTIGEIVDTLGFESLTFIIQAGAITDGVYNTVLEESDDPVMTVPTPVVPDETIGELPRFRATDSDTVRHFGSIGKMRYQRINIVSTIVTTGAVMSAVALLGNAKSAPTSETVNV